jgi:hypothetical protein
MAQSGTVTGQVNDYVTLCLTWRETAQSVKDNTTTVAWSLDISSTDPTTVYSNKSSYWSVAISGNTSQGNAACELAYGDTFALASGTTVVTHNSDGTKIGSISISYQFSGYGFVTGSSTVTFTPINRAPTISVPEFTMGTAGTIKVTPADSSFTQTLTWEFGSASGTIATNTSSTSVSWTPPADTMGPEIPDSYTGVGTITCTSYSGSTQVGRASATFTAYVPDDAFPTISSVSIAEATSGVAKQFGCYVQNKSTLSVSFSASGAYGSTIKRSWVTVLGVTYSGTSITTGVLTSTGTNGYVQVEIHTEDSRGCIAGSSTPVKVVAYSNPAITAFSVQRCNSSGTADSNGSYAKLTYSYSVSSVNSKNTCSMKIQYKRSTASSWAGTLTSGASYSASTSVVPTTTLSSDYQWDIMITVADYFTSTSYTAILPSAAVIMDFLASGNGMAIGKTAEVDGALEVGWNAYFHGDVYGSALGLRCLPEIDANSDLNDLLTIGCYGIQTYARSKTISNLPSSSAGVVYVMSATGGYAETADYIYLKQVFVPLLNTSVFCWVRDVSKHGSSASWTYSSWRSIKYG